MLIPLAQHASKEVGAGRVNRFWASIFLVVLAAAAGMVATVVENEFGGPPSPAAVVERWVAAERVTLAEEPGDIDARLGIAAVYARAGFRARAAREFKLILDLYPGSPAALAGLGRLYEEDGSPVRAEKYYQLAVESDPDDIDSWSGLGRLATEAKDLRAAADHWGRVVALRPSLADAQVQLGLALERTGRSKEAGAAYEEALRYVPDYKEAMSGLARVGDRGRTDE